MINNHADLYMSAFNCAAATLDDDPGPKLDAEIARMFKNDGGNEADWFQWITYVRNFRAQLSLMRRTAAQISDW